MESRAASEVAQRVPMSARRSGIPSKLSRLSSLVHSHPHPLFISGFRGPPCTLTCNYFRMTPCSMYQGLALRDSRGCQDGFRFMLMNMMHMLGWVEIIRGRSPLSGGVN